VINTLYGFCPWRIRLEIILLILLYFLGNLSFDNYCVNHLQQRTQARVTGSSTHLHEKCLVQKRNREEGSNEAEHVAMQFIKLQKWTVFCSVYLHIESCYTLKVIKLSQIKKNVLNEDCYKYLHLTVLGIYF